ncbi:MAG: VWA domain-containing protein [Acidobacteria bacterium]|nr:VWA domain-containing protein [Acidobacteriota bacterium]
MTARFLLPWLWLISATSQAQTTIQVDVQLVQIGFSVRDAEGSIRAGLGADDFEVFEDGKRQKVARFGAAESLPLRLGVLTDLSGSQHAFVKAHRADVKVFLDTVLGPADQVFLVGFGNRLRLLAEYSDQSESLIHYLKLGLKNVYFPVVGPDVRRRGGTAFFDAIYHSIRQKFVAEAGRRALVVMSDGSDNSSGYTLLDAIEAGQEQDVRIFSLWYSKPGEEGTPIRDQYGRRVMDRLAGGTGGERFEASHGVLGEQFRRIAEDLRSSYELGYYSSNARSPGVFHSVEIRPKQVGLQVRAKPGYYSR